jgi:hypothetical protein
MLIDEENEVLVEKLKQVKLPEINPMSDDRSTNPPGSATQRE